MSEKSTRIVAGERVRELREASEAPQEQGRYLFPYAGHMQQIRSCFFGAALTCIRKRQRLSRYEVAKRAGLSEEYLYKLEKSFREPRAGMIVRLGRALGIPPGELLNEMDKLMHAVEVESISRKEE